MTQHGGYGFYVVPKLMSKLLFLIKFFLNFVLRFRNQKSISEPETLYLYSKGETRFKTVVKIVIIQRFSASSRILMLKTTATDLLLQVVVVIGGCIVVVVDGRDTDSGSRGRQQKGGGRRPGHKIVPDPRVLGARLDGRRHFFFACFF